MRHGAKRAGNSCELRAERRGRRGQIDEDVVIPHVACHFAQRIVVAREAIDLFHQRRANQAPLEVVGPRVIGTLNAAVERAALAVTQPRAPMAAHVVKRARAAAPVADNQDAGARHVPPNERPARRDVFRASGGDPHRRENAIHLGLKPRGIRVNPRRQRAPFDAEPGGVHDGFIIHFGF